MKKKIAIVGTYSLIHLIVDMCCLILVLGKVVPITSTATDVMLAIILYNMFGFAFQLPFGVIADRLNKNAYVSAIGCAILAIAFAVFKLPFISCILAGIGNALFHVGGGIDVLNISKSKATLPGIYVATGALGLYLGQKFLSFFVANLYIPIIMLALSTLGLCVLYKKAKNSWKIENNSFDITFNSKTISIIALLLTTVCIRGYAGMILKFDWKSNALFGLFAVLAVIFGKMLGGIVGDKLGWKKTALISLGVATVLFNFAFSNWILGVIAILLFNMTMPITLTALSNTFNDAKGFAFGLTTLALFIGSIPALLEVDLGLFNPIGLTVLTIMSLVSLILGLVVYSKNKEAKVC